jgi:hypothetical protein
MYSKKRYGKFDYGTLLVCGLVWKTLLDMFLSMGHRNFMFWSTGHCAESTEQIYFKFFLSIGHCAVSHRQIHEFIVFRR